MRRLRNTTPCVADTARGRRIAALLATAAVLSGGATAAQDNALFEPLDPVAIDSAGEAQDGLPSTTARMPTRGGETVRHRKMRVDFDRLAAVRETVEAGKPARLDLNLFDDVLLKAVDLRMAPTASGGYSLSGRLEGVLFGTAVLVVNGEVVAGSIRSATGTYTIDAADGVCHIREVDPSMLPPLGEPLRPTQPMMSPGGTRFRTPPSPPTAADDEHGSVTDVLVVFTPAVTAAKGGLLAAISEVELFVAETNQAYVDSGVDQQIFLTRAVEVDYIEAGDSSLDLNRLRNPDDGHMDIVHELREKTGSDLVHLITETGTVCGIAYLMTEPRAWFQGWGFGLTIRDCGGPVVAHELGHNMGLRHDRHVDSANTPYPYSHGYINQAAFEEDAEASTRWRTIMAYNDQCSDAGFNCTELLRFSNSDQEYEGDPLGIAEGANAADARRSLNETRHLVAGFREAGPDLVPSLLITDRAADPGAGVVTVGAVSNQGRIESAETTAGLYVSDDPVVDKDDTLVRSYDIEVLGAKEIASLADVVNVSATAGGYYYGICVDDVEGETDTDNCSPGLYVTVGPTVSVADAQTTEGESLSFPVTLSEARATPVDVEWALIRETAVAGVDYDDVSGTLTIPANQTAGSISVATIADDIPEADDTFTIELGATTPAAPAGVVLSVDGHRATGTIKNDDGDPKFQDAGLEEAVLAALNKLSDDEVTLDDLASLRSLDATGREIENLGGLEPATALRSLVLTDNEVGDLTPLGHLGELRRLILDRNGFRDVAALAPLKGLTSLSLTGNPVDDVSALSALSGLTRLWLDQTDLTDVTPLAELEALEMLFLDKARELDPAEAGITDISALAGLTKLTDLNLNFNDVVDISALAGMKRLNYLDLWGNEIEDLTPLGPLRNLFWMDLDDNRISDIGPLANLGDIESLHLNGNAVANLEPLAGLTRLETLGLNGNGINDLGPLAGLTFLRFIWLGENAITDISPLAGLDGLVFLDLGNNRIRDISTLADLIRLGELHLQGNRIRDISPLAELTRLVYLDLSGNDIRDIEPLVSNAGLSAGDEVYIQGNPLSGTSLGVHVPALIDRGMDLAYIGVSVAAASAVEGEEMEFVVRLSSAAADAVTVDWTARDVSATAGDDYPTDQSGAVSIAADALEATVSVPTNQDAIGESHELVEIVLTVESGGFPDHVAFAEATGLGLIVDPEGPAEDVLVFASASDGRRQGFLRVVNRTGRNVVHIVAADDAGTRFTTSLAMDPGETVHFNSNDLEGGNIAKGLSRGVGQGSADWRLELSANDVDVLTYMRTNDGFLTSLHDVVPTGSDGYSVPIFNPGKNTNQESLLRLINGGDADAEVTITGVDDKGTSSEEAGLTLGSGEARTVSAADLEKGTGLTGALGTPSGKWRLLVASDQPIIVASLMQTPTGHLTNLSTTPDNTESVANGTAHHVYLFPSASDATMRQGFVRVVNRGGAGSVEIRAYDETDDEFETVALQMDAGETVHFNSNDLETGNAGKGLSGSTGAGQGDWRLVLTSALDLDVLAYMRTEDGFLTSMHDTVPATGGVHRVPIFNPGSNRNQASRLRLVNTGDDAAGITISGVDDTGQASAGKVRLSLPAGKVRTVTAEALEAGADDLDGALGDGFGKWALDVNSDTPIHVLNLLESPTGHLTNLSTRPALESAGGAQTENVQ